MTTLSNVVAGITAAWFGTLDLRNRFSDDMETFAVFMIIALVTGVIDVTRQTLQGYIRQGSGPSNGPQS